ncbi:MAG TPA: transglycosylase domain-containing protein [Candidatus Saccharimonadia bacterium]|nr:transglycosylase domain-containing protein [Candidatus Saccharimonadia bacterium]
MSNTKQRQRRQSTKNTYTTKSGKTIKINRNLGERMRASREARAQRKAAYLSTLPKEPWKRLLYRMHPKRLYKYWFSREGGIMALKIAGISFVIGFLLIVGLFAYFRKDLPKIHDINNGGNSGGSIAYYDRTNTVLLFQDYDEFKRVPVASKDISSYMKDATIAIEDKDFYHEGAFNVKGITRAAVNNLKGGSTQGGSTITQQLVKLNEGWTSDHTVSRKVKELILAVELEREYSKDDILTAYLNMAPYSGHDYGVEAAAQDYFHTDASKLDIAQAAFLASIPKQPGTYSPYASPRFNPLITEDFFDQTDVIARQQYVLGLMAKQGYITEAQAATAKAEDVIGQIQPLPANHFAGMKPGFAYAVQAAKKELNKDFPASVIKNGGWRVTTTIDVGLENLANKSLNDNAKILHKDRADDAAFVAEDNATGQIVALVGGMDFTTQQLNYANDAPISPGSSIKPYSYATLINDNNNVGGGSAFTDNKAPLPGYPCTNPNKPEDKNPGNCLFDDTRSNYQTVTIRYALGNSLNIPAVKAFTSTNPQDTSTAADAGNWRRASINNTMSSINAMMGTPDGYKCYDPIKLQQEGRNILMAQANDVTPCGAAAGIGNEAYTTLTNHVNGIATLARMGQVVQPTFILKVSDASGKALSLPAKPKPKQVLKADSAYIVNNMAADPGASYLALYGGSCPSTATSCSSQGYRFHRYKGWDNAIKTGTNQDINGMMMSWNTKYTAGVWIGNYDGTTPFNGTPENVTDPIMKQFMQGAIDSLGNVKPVNWTQPSDIKVLSASHSNVPFKNEATPPSTDLYPSWYVGGKSSGSNNSQATDKVSGLLATSCTPQLARQTGSSNSGQWNVDIYAGGTPNISSTASTNSSSAASAQDNVHDCKSTSPDVQITAVNGVSTGSGATLTCPATSCQVLVHVDAGSHLLTDSNYPQYPGTLTLIVNGQTVATQEVDETNDYPLTFTPPSGSSGSIQLEAQVSDSLLYSGTDTQAVTVTSGTTTSYRKQTNTSGDGDTNGILAGFTIKHRK